MRDAMTERFENLFARLAQRREGAFVPFVNLCDPDPETSLAVLETLVASGADALELGIPFSDPCADGPVVEASADRALANGATPARCLDVLRRFRTAHPETPVCLMLYINLVAIVPPNASDERVARIAGLTSGYTYLLSRVGITGTDHASGTPAERIIRDLERAKAPPTLLGFGISTPGHVRRALEAGAAGVIVGSALVKIVSEHLGDRDAMLKALGSAAASFKAATRTA